MGENWATYGQGWVIKGGVIRERERTNKSKKEALPKYGKELGNIYGQGWVYIREREREPSLREMSSLQALRLGRSRHGRWRGGRWTVRRYCEGRGGGGEGWGVGVGGGM